MIESLRTSAKVDRRELGFKALAGLIGGAIGWMPVELASNGHSLTDVETTWSMITGYASMAILAGMIGGMVTAAAGQRFAWTPAVKKLFIRGFVICFLVAIPETYASNLFFSAIIQAGGWSLGHPGSEVYLVFARLVGWSLMGVLLGAGVGAASLAIPNVLKGALGGLIGGLVGGLGFDLIGSLTQTGLLPRLIGLSAIGLAIGFFIGLVQELTKTAWIAVEAGRLKGRQYRIEGSTISVGRAEENRVGLFGDPAVQPRHAVIERQGDRYMVRNLAVQAGTFVNGERIETAELREGDRLRIGDYELSFHVRTLGEVQRSRAGESASSVKGEERASARAPSPPLKPQAASPAPSTGVGAPCLARATGERLRLRAGGDATRIGRALDNDIVLEDASVSRHHAVIEARNGSHVLRDLGSQNGTWLASNRVNETPLNTGDPIRLGDVSFTFYA
ncbi:MAG: FHA domain-containing protein [Candidatus Binataceae bacterium]